MLCVLIRIASSRIGFLGLPWRPMIVYLTYETEFSSIFSDAGTFCHDHGLGQLTRDVKSDVRTLYFRGDVIFAPPRS